MAACVRDTEVNEWHTFLELRHCSDSFPRSTRSALKVFVPSADGPPYYCFTADLTGPLTLSDDHLPGLSRPGRFE